MADHHDVAAPGVVVEMAQPQLGEHRARSGRAPRWPVSPPGIGDVEVALVPALVDGVELLDGRVVVAVLQRRRPAPRGCRRTRGRPDRLARRSPRPSARARSATECATIAGGCASSRGELPGLLATRGRSARAPGGRVSSRRSTLPQRLAVPDQYQPPAHVVAPLTGLPAQRASQRDASSSCGGSAPDGRARRPGTQISHVCTTPVQRLECLGDRVVVDVADTVEEEHVGAQFGSGGPGFDAGQVDVADRRTRSSPTPARRARCPAAAPPRCGRRRCGPAAAPAGRPARTGCGRWPRRRRRRPARRRPSAAAASAVLTPASARPSATSCGRGGIRVGRARTAASGRLVGQPAPHLRGGDGERGHGLDVGRLWSGPDDDGERHVEGELGVDLQRRCRRPGCPGSAAPSPRSSSRSARMRSRRRRARTAASAAVCCRCGSGVTPSAAVPLAGTMPAADHLQQRRLGEGSLGSEVGDARHVSTLSVRPLGIAVPLDGSLAQRQASS